MSELLSWSGDEDRDILPRLLNLHAPCEHPRILDVTANRGEMWEGTGLHPLRLDLDPWPGVRVLADCRALPFAAGSFDVLVFDPPHGHGAASRRRGLDGWADQYGLGRLPSHKANGVAALFPRFLVDARRVLRRGGIILAKLADEVYQDRYRFTLGDFYRALERAPGLTWCDLHVKVRKAAGAQSGQWAAQYHTRRAHSYWIVVRKGSCQGRGLARPTRPQQTALAFAPDAPAPAGVGA